MRNHNKTPRETSKPNLLQTIHSTKLRYIGKRKFSNGILEKAKKQDLVLLAEELGQKVSDKMTNIELRNIIIGSKDYEEFVRDQLSVILEERFERKRRAEEHVRETSPAVLTTIPVTTPIKEEKGMDDLRVVHVKVRGEQEMVNAVIDTGAQMPVVRPDVGRTSIDNRGSIQITSAFGEHEMGEIKIPKRLCIA
ncbi:hypothetical protein TNCV_3000161 [Trichonephila clavipes]|nr:hypothetical protein TNCV_3000161 [Trichonephila clavipes]